MARSLLIACSVFLLLGLWFVDWGSSDFDLSIEKQGETIIDGDEVIQFRLQYLDGRRRGRGAQYSEVAHNRLPPVLRQVVEVLGVGGSGVFTAKSERYTPEAAVDPVPRGGVVSGRIEVLGAIPEEFAKPAYPVKYSIGLLVVDCSGTGKISMLGGAPWQKKSGSWIDARDCRMLKMDGFFRRLWEWVGPDAGLLVVSPDKKMPDEITGEHLVSTYAGLVPWDSAYEVLAVADADSNGLLEQRELDNFSVWVDRDSNGEVGDGEVRPAGEVFDFLKVEPEADKVGGKSIPDGAGLKGGRAVGTWEFWSRGQAWRTRPGREDSTKAKKVP